VGLAEEGEGLAANLLRRYGLTPQALRQRVSKVVGKGAEDGRAETPPNTPELDKYSRDLTKMARDGKLDPVIGRAQEIETTIEVLARRKKNNPVLIGEPGVGKTAIVEGLAQRMVAGEVPETLRDKRLMELNINAMVAGAKYRGEFEERVQKVLKEISEHQGEMILFIDEVHTIVGAGQGGGEGGLDVANVFKPMMARGELEHDLALRHDEHSQTESEFVASLIRDYLKQDDKGQHGSWAIKNRKRQLMDYAAEGKWGFGAEKVSDIRDHPAPCEELWKRKKKSEKG
jgi:ATP-dependent Clp protease ATP-binding subunit ClpA